MEKVPILLKIRGGVEVDCYGKKAGKGALLSENLSMTLGTSQDQYLFQPVAYGVVTKGNGDAFLNEKTHTSLSVGGGQAGQGYPCVLQAYSVENHPSDSRYRIDDSGIVQTLRSRMGTGGGNEPLVMLEHKVFDARGNGDGKITATITGVHEHFISDYTNVVIFQQNQRTDYTNVVCFQNTGHGWWNESDIGATVRTPCGGDSIKANLVCTTNKVINLNKDDVQSKAVIDPNGIAPALYAGECRGGGGEVYVLQGNGIDRADTAGCNGKGWREDVCYTLNTIDRPAVVAILRLDNGSVDPLVRGDKSPTIRRGNGPGGTGHVAVCYGISSMGSNAMLSDNPHSGIYEAKTSRTLDLNGGNPACNQGGIIVCQRKTDVVYPEKTGSLMASGYSKNGTQEAMNGMYVVCYWDGGQTAGTLTANNAGGAQRMPDKDNFNCVIEEIKHG